MGVHAPDQVTITTRPVHWTRFPARSLPHTDWTDHEAAHRGVMRLFQTHLDGAPEARRAAAQILYRVDLIGDEPIVMVQSAIAPELLPVEARTMVLGERSWQIEAGALIRFRAAVNPLRRNKRQGTERVVSADEVPAWLAERLGACVTDIDILNHTRDTLQYQARGNARLRSTPPIVVVDTIDCTANVADEAALERLRRAGLGRAKAYGCGLLTAQRIG